MHIVHKLREIVYVLPAINRYINKWIQLPIMYNDILCYNKKIAQLLREHIERFVFDRRSSLMNFCQTNKLNFFFIFRSGIATILWKF